MEIPKSGNFGDLASVYMLYVWWLCSDSSSFCKTGASLAGFHGIMAKLSEL